MAISDIQTAFSAGEISPELYGEVDLKKISSAATTMRNFVVNYRGGAFSRGGLAFVGRCLQATGIPGTIATGSVFFGSNPSPGDTVTLNGVVWTFVASGATGNQVNIAGNAGITIGLLQSKLSASVNPSLTVATYIESGGPSTATLGITYKTVGTVGNSYTLSASVATPSGTSLTGGSDPGGFSAAFGNIAFGSNPSSGDTVTLAGTVFTFVTSGAVGNEVNIAAGNAALTIANFVNQLSTSVDPTISAVVYDSGGTSSSATLFMSYKITGVIGNQFTLAASSGTPSGGTLTGGTGSSGAPPRLITFQFSITQGYELEFGDQYVRFIFQGGYIVENPVAITGATNANPCVISVAGTPFSNGDWVFASNVGGMTQLNGNTYIVAASASGHFALNTLDGTPLDATGYGTFTGGGSFSRVLTIASPYAALDLSYLKFSQSADVMSLTCSNTMTNREYPPYTLTRLSAIHWTLTATVFDAVTSPPASTSAASSGNAPSGGVNATFAYVVTYVDTLGNESVASEWAVCNGADIQVEAGSNTVSWSSVATGGYYNVYRAPASVDGISGAIPVPDGSIFGFVGSAYGLSLVDSLEAPDLSQTPPTHGNPFAPGRILGVNVTGPGSGLVPTGVTYAITTSTGSQFFGVPLINSGVLGGVQIYDGGKDYAPSDTITFTSGSGSAPTGTLVVGPQSGTYPGVVTYFQERVFYANSFNNPDTFWGSQTALFNNFDISIPPIATDAITASPSSEQVNGIQWLIPMPGGMIAMTGLRAWQIIGEGSYALNSQPVTPTTVQAQPQAFNGCSATIPPVVVDYDVLYVQAVGQSTVFDLSWNFFSNIYTGNDLTLLSSHLFFGRLITQWAWSRQPYKVLWACCDDGTMLSLTYLKEQEVYGWARHDTMGLVLSIASVSEPPVNAVYAVVQRPSAVYAGGIYVVERMDDRLWSSVEDAYPVDSGVSNPMDFPNSTIQASKASGAGAVFTTSNPCFSAASVGQIIRLGGGIAEVTAYGGPTSVTGFWVLAASAGPLGVPLAVSGYWSIAAQVNTLFAPHLSGQSGLVGLADGVPITGLSCTPTGTIQLPFFASNVKVGFPFMVQLQTPYVNGNAVVQGARKAIQAVTVRVVSSGSFQIGTNQPDGAAQNPPQLGPTWSLNPAEISQPTGGQTAPIQYTTPGGQQATQVFTGDIRIPGVNASWISKGQVAIQQLGPMALEVVAVVPEFLPGDISDVTYKQQPQQQPSTARGPGRWQLNA